MAESSVAVQPGKIVVVDAQDNLLSECRLMLQFAREVGTDIPAELARNIATLDALLTKDGLVSISELPSSLLKDDPPPTGQAKSDVSPAQLVFLVHGGLSRAIDPATPLTLQATQPPNGRRGMFSRMPRIVKFAAWTAIVSAFVFIITAARIATHAAEAKTKAQAPAPATGSAK